VLGSPKVEHRQLRHELNNKAVFTVKKMHLREKASLAHIQRIRVTQGGHDVDESVIRRRFDKGWNNFHNIYKRLVDAWALYDNSGEGPQLIDVGENYDHNKKDN